MGLEKSTLKVVPFILLSSVVNKSQLCAAVLYELLALGEKYPALRASSQAHPAVRHAKKESSTAFWNSNGAVQIIFPRI